MGLIIRGKMVSVIRHYRRMIRNISSTVGMGLGEIYLGQLPDGIAAVGIGYQVAVRVCRVARKLTVAFEVLRHDGHPGSRGISFIPELPSLYSGAGGVPSQDITQPLAIELSRGRVGPELFRSGARAAVCQVVGIGFPLTLAKETTAAQFPVSAET